MRVPESRRHLKNCLESRKSQKYHSKRSSAHQKNSSKRHPERWGIGPAAAPQPDWHPPPQQQKKPPRGAGERWGGGSLLGYLCGGESLEVSREKRGQRALRPRDLLPEVVLRPSPIAEDVHCSESAERGGRSLERELWGRSRALGGCVCFRL